MKWLELSIAVDPELVEAVQEVFHRFGGGVTVVEQHLQPAEDEDAVLDTSKPVVAKTYLPLDDNAEQKRQDLVRGLTLLSLIRPLPSPQVCVVDEEEWQDAWKTFFPVVAIGEGIIIKPSWREYNPRPGQVVVELDPGMAFGTGLHPSTQLCLEELERSELAGQAVLDLGTGSGILAITAAMLGAAKVLALDTDETAVKVATENVARNGMSRAVTVAVGTLPVDSHCLAAGFTTFDTAVANLTARTVAQMAGELYAAVKAQGLLIAGGIIAERVAEAGDALVERGFTIIKRPSKDGWYALVARKA